MKLFPAIVPPLLALAVGFSVACGGGSSTNANAGPDMSKIPTATLPPTLPEPILVGTGAIRPGGSTYTIQSGDTLASIASEFGLTLEDLRAANPDVDPGALHAGEVIKLPPAAGSPAPPTPTEEPAPAPTEPPAQPTTAPPEPEPTEPPVEPTAEASSLGQAYTVQSGDIPVTIAEQFGISVEALLAANPGLDPTGLQVGQVIIIPPASGE